MDDMPTVHPSHPARRGRRYVWLVLIGFALIVSLAYGWPRYGVANDAGTGRTAADLVFKAAAPRPGDKIVFCTECDHGPDVLDRIEAAAERNPQLRILDSDVRGEARPCAIGQSRVDVVFSDGSAIRLQGPGGEWGDDLKVAAASVIRP